jgi:hypothetical protein
MSMDLVGVENGQVVFGEAVSRLADSLSPLGAAARVFAESCACIAEMRRLNLEGRRIDADKTERLAGLENRRVAVGAALRDMHDQVGYAELSAQSLRGCIENMQRALVNPRVSIAEKKLLVETLRFFTSDLVNQHSVGGDKLVSAIDVVLNGAGAAAPPRPSIGAGQQNSAQRNSAQRNSDQRNSDQRNSDQRNAAPRRAQARRRRR